MQNQTDYPVNSSAVPPPPKSTFNIGEVLKRAWQLTSGTKAAFWSIAIIIVVIFIGISLIRKYFMPTENGVIPFQYIVLPLVQAILVAPFSGGAIAIMIRRARGESIAVDAGFHYFNRAVSLIIAMLIISFCANVPLFLAAMPSVAAVSKEGQMALFFFAELLCCLIYVFTILTVPFIVDKNYKPLQAIGASIQRIKHCWFKAVILFFIVGLFLLLALIPMVLGSFLHLYAGLIGQIIFLVALIWLLPFTFAVQGELYHELVD